MDLKTILIGLLVNAGGVLANVERAKGHGVVADVIEQSETAAQNIIAAVKAQASADPSIDLTAEQADAHVDAAKAEALAAGDEAQARIDARHADPATE